MMATTFIVLSHSNSGLKLVQPAKMMSEDQHSDRVVFYSEFSGLLD